MLSKCWMNIECLLLLCYQNTQDLTPVLQILGDALPKTAIELLIVDWNERVNFKLFAVQASGIAMTPYTQGNHLEALIEKIKDRAFAAAIILTKPDRSPYTFAYLCYLAGIPIRIGQSQEFGGGVLSHWITPPPDSISVANYYLYLIEAVGILKPVSSFSLNP